MITLKDFFVVANLFIAAVGLLSCEQSKIEQPNIVLVFADDLGYADLGCYGQKLIQTPNIDKMAAQGIKFTDFYAAAPVCAPSRCSLITGKHGGNAFIRSNINQMPHGQLPIPDEEITLPELLHSNGYATGAFGKWSLGAPYNSGDPLTQGFDHFFGSYCQCLAHNYYPEMIWRNKDTVFLRNETVPVEVNFIDYPLSYATKKVDYTADLYFDEAMEFIDKNKDEPFFVYFSTTLPHSNGEAPADEVFEVPDWGVYSDSAWSPVDKGYASMVTKLDTQMGLLFEKLKSLGIDKNTLVIFTSDNGPTLFAKRFNSAGQLRGRKRDLYEGGIRIPFIAWWPGKIPQNKITNTPAAMYDLMPTFCDLSGAKVPEQADGRSLLQTLLGGQQSKAEPLFWDFYEGERSPKRAVRKGNWKLIQFNCDDPNKETVELYNLRDDIGEKNNLAVDNQLLVKELSELLKQECSAYVNKDLSQY